MAKPKSFKAELNPALQFISIPKLESIHDSVNTQNNTLNSKNAEKPDGYKINPQYIETKSKRVQLLMQPSLYAKIKILADAGGVSVNEYIHAVLNTASERD